LTIRNIYCASNQNDLTLKTMEQWCWKFSFGITRIAF